MRRLVVACALFGVSCAADDERSHASGAGDAGIVDASGGWPEASADAGDGGGGDGGAGGNSGAAGAGGASGASGAGGLPGGKARYSAVIANFDTQGKTWARHVNYGFDGNGSVAATHWEWDSSLFKGKTAYTEHRCTFEGITKDCFVFTPTGWVEPAKQYQNRSGSYQTTGDGKKLTVTWNDGAFETWNIESTSTAKLSRITFVSSSFGATHGAGYGSNASWQTFRTLPEIIAAGGLKKWSGQRAMAASNGSVVTVSDWASSVMNLSEFTSASWSSAGTTLHAVLPHSASVCTGACSGPYTGKIMYHLASTNTGRQMAYNNWCTCLAQAGEWPCYDRNMHPLALNSIIDDDGTHRGWLFVEQQNQPSYSGYQYQIGWFSDV